MANFEMNSKKNITIIDTVEMLQGNMIVKVPVIDGVKRYDLACGGISAKDVDDGIKMLSYAVDFFNGNVEEAKIAICMYTECTCKDVKIDDVINLNGVEYGIDAANTIAYNGKVEKVCDLSDMDEQELEQYPVEFKKLLLRTKLAAKVGRENIVIENNDDITTEKSLLQFIYECNKVYVAGCPVVDGELVLPMASIAVDEETLQKNLEMKAWVIGQYDYDVSAAVSALMQTMCLFGNEIYPDQMITIRGVEVLICSKDRKAYLGTTEIANLDDLGGVGLGKDAIKTLLSDRAELYINNLFEDLDYDAEIDEEDCDDDYENGYRDGYEDAINGWEQDPDLSGVVNCIDSYVTGYDEGYTAGLQDR